MGNFIRGAVNRVRGAVGRLFGGRSRTGTAGS
jgi:hypothetical protein